MEHIGLEQENITLTNSKDYYTVPEIIDQVKAVFDLNFSGDGRKMRLKIKQAIYRALEGKPFSQEEGRQRKRMYSRTVVYSLLNSECRNYFLKVKIEQEKSNFQKWADNQDKQKEAEAKLQKAKKQLEAVKNSRQIGDEYRKAIIASLEDQSQDDDSGEKPILLRIEEAKVRIFFQYLFESLIDFDASKYEADLQGAPDPSDLNPSDIEAASARRLLDLHNYYTGRVNLAAALNRLCQSPPTDTKPQEK